MARLPDEIDVKLNVDLDVDPNGMWFLQVDPDFIVEHHLHVFRAEPDGSGFVCTYVYRTGVPCSERQFWGSRLGSWGARIYRPADVRSVGDGE